MMSSCDCQAPPDVACFPEQARRNTFVIRISYYVATAVADIKPPQIPPQPVLLFSTFHTTRRHPYFTTLTPHKQTSHNPKLSTIMSGIFQSLGDLVTSVFEVIGSLFKTVFDLIYGVFSGVAHLFAGAVNMVIEFFKGIVEVTGGVLGFFVGEYTPYIPVSTYPETTY